MGQISNRFFVTSIKDGTVVTAVLYSNKTLTQLVNKDNGRSEPDWMVAPNQPTVYCVVRAGAAVKAPQNVKWYLNNVEILFGENPTTGTPSTNFNGIFKWDTVTVDNIACPAVKIVGNIITVQNQDNDVLTCTGKQEYNGADIDYSVSTTIRMSTMSSSGYYGWIEGDSFVTAQSGAGGTANMYAHLTTEGGECSSFKTKWFREGVTTSTERWPYPGGRVINAAQVQDVGVVASCDIYGSEITDYVVIRCDFYITQDGNDVKVYSAYWDVDDMEDEEELYICSYQVENVRSGLDVCLRENQSANMVTWVGKRGDQSTLDSKYQGSGAAYYCKLLDSEGNVITGSGTAAEGSQSLINYTNINNYITTEYQGQDPITPDPTTGFFRIDATLTQPVTGKGGKVIIQAAFADIYGGRVTGIIQVTA